MTIPISFMSKALGYHFVSVSEKIKSLGALEVRATLYQSTNGNIRVGYVSSYLSCGMAILHYCSSKIQSIFASTSIELPEGSLLFLSFYMYRNITLRP